MVKINPDTDAVLAVDVQKGFMPGTEPGYGELPAPEGEEVAAPLAALAPHVKVFAATGDMHTPDHSSFAENGGLWPVHAVAGTPGCELHPLIAAALTPGWFFAKGTARDSDQYSAFEVTDLADRLDSAGIKRLLIGGLVTNVCVLSTALDARSQGFEVVVLSDACRAIDPNGIPSGQEALEQLAAAGALICTTDDLSFE